MTVKKREMTAIQQSGGGGSGGVGAGGVGTIVPTFNSVAQNMDEAETPGIPTTP